LYLKIIVSLSRVTNKSKHNGEINDKSF